MAIGEHFSAEGIPYYRGTDMHSFFIDMDSSPYRIPYKVYALPFLKRSHLQRNDVLISIVGTIGDVALFTDDKPATCNCKLAIVRANHELLPEYIAAFFSSKYGQWQIERYTRGSVQMGLIIEDFDQLSIPLIQRELQQKIADGIQKSRACLQKSLTLYSAAEAYLLECLGMGSFIPNTGKWNVRSFQESLAKTGRLDAEFYQPKYDSYLQLVQRYAGGAAPLGELCTINEANFSPAPNQEYRYIELADIGKAGDITGCTQLPGCELPSRARRRVERNDVLVSSIEGSLGSCALIPDYYDGALCSTGFHVVQSDKLNPETLLTLFLSEPIQQLLRRGCSGTILSGISRQELEQIPLPLIRADVQEEIPHHIQQSFALRQEAKGLLEAAKVSVEQAVSSPMGAKLLNISELIIRAICESQLAMRLLLRELGLSETSCNPTYKPSYSVVSLTSSLHSSGRLDAEYYQPRYEWLTKELSTLCCCPLGELVRFEKSIEPGSEAYQATGIPFVRVSDLGKFGIEQPSVHLAPSDFTNTLLPQRDTILLSKDGSVGIAYKTEKDLNAITSSAILHLTVKSPKVLPDYLTLLLNSPAIQMQAERDAGGSIIQHWKPAEIAQVSIPILPMAIQHELSMLVQQSFALRREAKGLLDKAILSVEEAIASGS